MDVTVRLQQDAFAEPWWVVLAYGGALGCVLLAVPDPVVTSLLAMLLGVDGWRTAARYALRRHPSSVVGVHVKDGRIAGLWRKDGSYTRAAGQSRLVRFGVLDVLFVPRAPAGLVSPVDVAVDAHRSLDDASRHLLRFAARDVGQS